MRDPRRRIVTSPAVEELRHVIETLLMSDSFSNSRADTRQNAVNWIKMDVNPQGRSAFGTRQVSLEVTTGHENGRS
jgi:hypothetical protein